MCYVRILAKQTWINILECIQVKETTEPMTLGFVLVQIQGLWVRFPLRSIRFFNLSMSLCNEKFFVTF